MADTVDDRGALFDEDEELPRTQLVIFVRHAMSRWNLAQANYGIVTMMRENDHGLADDGRRQAVDLRRRIRSAMAAVVGATPCSTSAHSPDVSSASSLVPVSEATEDEVWMEAVLHPNIVYTSPFTRAIETAIIGLWDILPDNRMIVMREARENKNFGGADSTGVAIGNDIILRVEEDLQFVYESASCQRESTDAVLADVRAINLDTSDVLDEWWGPFIGDGEADLHDRIARFVRKLRRTRGRMVDGSGVSVVVGHSLFFRTIFQTYFVTPPRGCPWLDAVSLKQNVLPYCGVIGARFEWDGQGNGHIAEAVPLLGTQLARATVADGSFQLQRQSRMLPFYIC